LAFCRQHLVPNDEERKKSLPFESDFHYETTCHEITWDSINQVFHVKVEGIVFQLTPPNELKILKVLEKITDMNVNKSELTFLRWLSRNDFISMSNYSITEDLIRSIIQQGNENNILTKTIMSERPFEELKLIWWEKIIPMVIDEGREDLLKLIPVDTVRKDIIPNWSRTDLNAYLIEAVKGRDNPFDKLRLD
jgi:hypothetical protein